MKQVLLFSAIVAIASCDFINHIFSDEFIEKTNQKAGGMWVAERGFHPQTSHSFLRDLMGVIKSKHHHHRLRKKVIEDEELKDLPKEFDPRKKWPMCPSIKDVLDQGSCGSCWAFGAASAMSDRLCIHSGGKIKDYVSAENLLSCCYSCGFGCQGGFPGSAWKFWRKKGLVTGGKYGTTNGCQPYDIQPCEHHTNGTRPPCINVGPTPKCHRYCENTKYRKEYNDDKSYGQEPYEMSQNPLHIMKELMTNGPMEVSLSVYEDFLNYKSGVYKHVHGASLGMHAVRLLGWGEENGHPYWLIANSWNFDWGNKGLFKILRGSNECGIEESAIASVPKL